MKNPVLLYCLSAILYAPLFSQANLIEEWDGNGDVNITTSYPDNYGWDVTVGVFNYANSTSGVRWNDVTSGHILNGANYTGRLLMIRWDGAGGTSLSSVYSYPVTLETHKKYQFSWIYEWWNNASAPLLTVGIGTDRTGGGLIVSADFTCSSTRQLLQEGDMSFFVSEGGSYYLTIKANNLAALCGIGELSVTEVEPVLECSVPSVVLNYYEAAKTVTIFPNGSGNPINIVAPEGIGLSASSLPSSGGDLTIFSADSSDVTGTITVTQGADEIVIPVTAAFPEIFLNPVPFETLNSDGAWCWFNDPRAIYYKGVKEQTYLSWVNSLGDIMIASYNHETGVYTEKLLFPRLETDDHDNPAIFIRRDGRLVVYFSKHTSAPAHRFISTNPEDISSWGDDYRFGVNVTYPYPFQVGDDIYVFYRGLDWHPTLIISNDDGETMGTPQQFIAGGGSRPYARYCQDNTGAIHVAFTTGHPRDEPQNRIYYARFKDGKFYTADGTFIKDFTGTETALNIDLHEAETVYAATHGKGWIWDITVDENNHPVMVYASFPSDTDHRYHYSRWTGSEWFSTELTNAGKWFPQTVSGGSESEPNYSGGIILDYDDPSVVYLSKQVKGVFEIFRFTTPDLGITWDSAALTWDTPADIVNARPIVPRHHKKGVFDLVWMRGQYIHYNNYHTSLVFWCDTVLNAVNEILFDEESIEITKGTSRQLSVTFVPFITANKELAWSSSDGNIVSFDNGLITGNEVGTAAITATSSNGESAFCEVRVVSPVYMTDVLFDFGTAISPVDSGARQVTESTLFENSFGWTSPVLTRDRGTGTDELRDFNMSATEAVFKVFVRPGKYHITAKQGDFSYAHDLMRIYVKDTLRSTASNSAGSYTTNEFEVSTDHEIIKFTFDDGGGSNEHWVINLLKLEALSLPPPALSLAEESVPAMTAGPGESNSRILHLSGTDLTADVFLNISGADPEQFSVTPATISRPGTGMLAETEITITYLPSEEGDHSAILVISSEGAADLTRALTGSTPTGISQPALNPHVLSQPGGLVLCGDLNFKIYSILGFPVTEISCQADHYSVNLEPGIYLVQFSDCIEKAIVY
ncbi:MAG: BNR-4 repeat-containing protein [Bacteroidales bacterium]|nr:BNR-4 repeat-containing protein [Bacteroidales bacterium]